MPLHRRVPKRGFHNPFRVEYAVVNLDTLGRGVRGRVVGDAGAAARARPRARRPASPIKVLGRGDITKKLTVQAHKFSGTAAEKIAAAGGVGGSRSGSLSGAIYGQSQEHLRDPGAAQAGAVHLRHRSRSTGSAGTSPTPGHQHRGADGADGAGGERATCSACTTCSRATTCRR